MKLLNNEHLRNEVILTLDNTEVLYNTAKYMKPRDLEAIQKLTEEVIVQMEENGVEVKNFNDYTMAAFPTVAKYVEGLQNEQ